MNNFKPKISIAIAFDAKEKEYWEYHGVYYSTKEATEALEKIKKEYYKYFKEN